MIYHIFKPVLPDNAPVSMKTMLIAGDEKQICHLHFLGKNDNFKNFISTGLQKDNSGQMFSEPIKQLNQYFNKDRHYFEDLNIQTKGTIFQKLSWQALTEIPYGHTWSYGQQAKHINRPKACRAVGGANGKNPISVFIP